MEVQREGMGKGRGMWEEGRRMGREGVGRKGVGGKGGRVAGKEWWGGGGGGLEGRRGEGHGKEMGMWEERLWGGVRK